MKTDPQVTAALESILQERGWTLVNDGGNGTFAAELVGVTTDPMVATASPDGLIRAINAYEERQNSTKVGWPSSMPTIIVGTVEESDLK
jgi:hypothetical protein